MKKIIVLPAYNAAKTLEATLNSLPKNSFDEIILVDDNSTDDTFGEARRLGVRAVRHETNKGYGGNQKTCYRLALEAGADIVLMLHPDYQYDPRVIPFMAGIIEDGICDVVLGNRIRTRAEALAGGMPLYKYLSNRFLTVTENLLTGQNLGEWHSGLRAYSRKVLETVNWPANSDDFVFDTQFLLQASDAGFRIGDIPVPAKYFDDASSISFSRSLKYGLETLRELLTYRLVRLGLPPGERYRARG